MYKISKQLKKTKAVQRNPPSNLTHTFSKECVEFQNKSHRAALLTAPWIFSYKIKAIKVLFVLSVPTTISVVRVADMVHIFGLDSLPTEETVERQSFGGQISHDIKWNK